MRSRFTRCSLCVTAQFLGFETTVVCVILSDYFFHLFIYLLRIYLLLEDKLSEMATEQPAKE